MTDYLSNLPVELIHKILDDITIFDILGCLCLLNKRLRLICLDYPCFRLNLSYIKKKQQFDRFCDQLIPISSQIISISLSDCNDATIPSKIEHFFLRFEVINETFSNLYSLHLSHVDDIIWKSIRHHIKSLMLLKSLFIDVACIRFPIEVDEMISYLLKDILFISTSVKYVYVNGNNISVYNVRLDFPEKQISSIEHLTLLDIPIDLEELYAVTPALRTLETTVKICDRTYEFRLNTSENVRRLSLNIFHLDFSAMEQLLLPMTRLTHLIIIGKNMCHDMCDGAAWERILPKIISFKFSFTFHKSTWTKERITLDSFRSLFWLEKKQWYVAYDRCNVSGFSLLYSVPYFMDAYPWHHMKGTIEAQLTGPQILSFNNVNNLTIDKELSTDYKCLRRLTNLKKLVILKSDDISRVFFHNIVSHIDISRITTILIIDDLSGIDADSFVRLVSSMSCLRSLGASAILLKCLFFLHWPNIRRLDILCSAVTALTTENDLTPNEMNQFYRSFNHLEYLSFHHVFGSNHSILLQNIPTTISNIVIYHPVGITLVDFPDFITCDWLEKNTQLRHFSYACNKRNAVSLWL